MLCQFYILRNQVHRSSKEYGARQRIETPALEFQYFSLPVTPPFFVDEEAAVFSLVFISHSLNYSMYFWLHHGWQESQWTAVKGLWKPAARLAEVEQCYPPLTLRALLPAKCLSPFPDGSWSSGKYFPSEFVARSSVDRNFKTKGHFGGFKKQCNFKPLMNGQ